MTSKPVERKTSTKKRRKVKPVYEILEHSMLILPMLIDGELGRNQIFKKIQDLKQPGINYKRDTLDSIRRMISEGLLEEIKDGQYLRQRLTSLGSKIAHLIIWTNEYNKAQRQLIKVARDYFTVNIQDYDPKKLKSILRNRRWTDGQIEDIDEILFYKHAKLGVSGVMEFSGQILKDGLINRYSDILESENNLGNLSKQIVGNLIGGAVLNQLEVAKDYGFNIGVMDNECLFDFLKMVGYPYPSFIFDKVKDLIVSDLNILGIQKRK